MQNVRIVVIGVCVVLQEMRRRLKHWFFRKGKNCKHCCLWCEYFRSCRADVLAQDERKDKTRKEGRGHEKL